MSYVIPKKLIDNAKFEWEELKGKTLKVNVGYDEETGSFAVAGRDEETGKIYLLHTEIKESKNKCIWEGFYQPLYCPVHKRKN